MSTTDKSKPTHRVYAVSRRGKSEKGYWQSIGAAWAHADGKGFGVKLEMLPLNGGEIVIREPRPDADEPSSPDNA